MGLQPDLGILLILGIGVFGGILGAWLFQRMRIPQVIGYIVIGLLIGESGLGILQQQNLPSLRPFSFLALAVIGFLVGGELESKIFKEHGKRFIGIMLGEGIGAFVLVGARLQLAGMSGWIWALVGVYVIGRTAGKYAGSRIGARLTGAPDVLRNYVGMGLFAQGGVAVGLSMMASQHLMDVQVWGQLDLGSLVVSTVTATTLIVQVLGPPCVKYAIHKADEAGRNITEEDLIGELTVGDMLQRDITRLNENDLLSAVFETVSQSRQLSFPVINREGVCTGVISLNSLKSLFLERHRRTDVAGGGRRGGGKQSPSRNLADAGSVRLHRASAHWLVFLCLSGRF